MNADELISVEWLNTLGGKYIGITEDEGYWDFVISEKQYFEGLEITVLRIHAPFQPTTGNAWWPVDIHSFWRGKNEGSVGFVGKYYGTKDDIRILATALGMNIPGLWPPTNQEMVQKSREDYARGEFIELNTLLVEAYFAEQGSDWYLREDEEE